VTARFQPAVKFRVGEGLPLSVSRGAISTADGQGLTLPWPIWGSGVAVLLKTPALPRTLFSLGRCERHGLRPSSLAQQPRWALGPASMDRGSAQRGTANPAAILLVSVGLARRKRLGLQGRVAVRVPFLVGGARPWSCAWTTAMPPRPNRINRFRVINLLADAVNELIANVAGGGTWPPGIPA